MTAEATVSTQMPPSGAQSPQLSVSANKPSPMRFPVAQRPSLRPLRPALRPLRPNRSQSKLHPCHPNPEPASQGRRNCPPRPSSDVPPAAFIHLLPSVRGTNKQRQLLAHPPQGHRRFNRPPDQFRPPYGPVPQNKHQPRAASPPPPACGDQPAATPTHRAGWT